MGGCAFVGLLGINHVMTVLRTLQPADSLNNHYSKKTTEFKYNAINNKTSSAKF